MFEIIVGNICSIGAMLSDCYSGSRKNKKEMMLAQCVSQFFYIASSLILKGYSATVQNVVTVFRNLFAVYGKKSKAIEGLFIVLPVVLGIYFNNRGLIGYIPIVANFLFTISLFVLADEPKKLKVSFILMFLAFSVFNFSILNFVSGVSCIVSAITTAVSLAHMLKGPETEENVTR